MRKSDQHNQRVKTGVFMKAKNQIMTKPWIINAIILTVAATTLIYAMGATTLIYIILTNIVYEVPA